MNTLATALSELPPEPDCGNSPRASRVPSPNAVTPDDHQLIAECRAGRTEAFGQLVSRYQQRLLHTLVGVLGSMEDAQDVAQDTFVHAFQKLDSFRGDSAFYSWLFRIAMNAAISRKRKHRRVTASIDAVRERTGQEPTDRREDGAPSHALERSERQALVRRALDLVPEEYRMALMLKELEDLKYEEIAEALDCPVGTVRSRIHRGRAELREKLRLLLRDP